MGQVEIIGSEQIKDNTITEPKMYILSEPDEGDVLYWDGSDLDYFPLVPSGGTLTEGSIVFAGPGGALKEDNDNLFWDDVNNKMGIGTNTPTAMLDVDGSADNQQLIVQAHSSQTANLVEWQNSGAGLIGGIAGDGRTGIGVAPQTNRLTYGQKTGITDTSGSWYGYSNLLETNPTSTSSLNSYGAAFKVTLKGSSHSSTHRGVDVNVTSEVVSPNTAANIRGGRFLAVSNASGTVAIAYGGEFSVLTQAAGTITDGRAGYFKVSSTQPSSVIATGYGNYIDTPGVSGGGVITNSYGIYIKDQNVASTLNYAIYTNAGLVEFNDTLVVDGSQDAVQLTVQAHSTQTANIVEIEESTETFKMAVREDQGAVCLDIGSSGDALQITEKFGLINAGLDTDGILNIENAKGSSISDSVSFLRGDIRIAGSDTFYKIRGLDFTTQSKNTSTSNKLTGVYASARLGSAAGRANSLTGVEAAAYTNDGTGGTVVDILAIDTYFGVSNAGVTATNVYGIRIDDVVNVGTITNTYGVYVGNMTAGTQTNDAFAIHTEAGGIVEFNDILVVDGSQDAIQFTLQAHSTQTANILEVQDSSSNVLAGIDERGVLFCDINTHARNFFAGGNAGNASATGADNVGIGYQALDALTDGTKNVAVGAYALTDLQDGEYNVAIGRYAGFNITSGSNNVAIGNECLFTNETADSNIAIGYATMQYSDDAANSVAIGYYASRNATTGGDNVALGGNSLYYNQTGTRNMAIGRSALQGATGISVSDNVGLGYSAGFLVQGDQNLFIGTWAGGASTTGAANIYIGYYAGSRQTTNSNLIIIDNQQRADVATELTNSIIYGVMAAAPADQTFRINASTSVYGKGEIIGNTDEVQFLIKANSTQNSNIAEWRDSSDNLLGLIDNLGRIGLANQTNPSAYLHILQPGSGESGLILQADTSGSEVAIFDFQNVRETYSFRVQGNVSGDPFLFRADSKNVWYIYAGAPDYSFVMIDTGAIGLGTQLPGAKLHINGIADNEQLIVEAHSTQTANIVEIHDSSSNVLAGADERGILFSHGNIDTNSLYIGEDAGNIADGGTYNVGIGSGVLRAATSSYNVGIGYQALYDQLGATYNIAIGYRAGYNLTTGSNNIVFGYAALYHGTAPSDCIAIGTAALSNQTQIGNVGIGSNAGEKGTSAQFTIAIGYQASRYNVTGDRNTVIGYQAGKGVESNSNSDNTFIGYSTGNAITTGSSNIFLGSTAGSRQTTNSNLLVVDNQQRADTTTELTHSIIYGIMASEPEDQSLRFNVDELTVGTDTDVDVALNFIASGGDNGVLTWVASGGDFNFDNDVIVDNSISTKPLSPSQVTGNTNNWAVNTHSFVRYDADGEYNLTGIVAGKDGQSMTFVNVGSNTVTLMNQDANSDAANRFITPGGSDVALVENEMAVLLYDDTTERWRILYS